MACVLIEDLRKGGLKEFWDQRYTCLATGAQQNPEFFLHCHQELSCSTRMELRHLLPLGKVLMIPREDAIVVESFLFVQSISVGARSTCINWPPAHLEAQQQRRFAEVSIPRHWRKTCLENWTYSSNIKVYAMCLTAGASTQGLCMVHDSSRKSRPTLWVAGAFNCSCKPRFAQGDAGWAREC